MLGEIGSVDLQTKRFANTIDTRRRPIQKHRPVCLRRLGTRRERNVVIEETAFAEILEGGLENFADLITGGLRKVDSTRVSHHPATSW